MDDYNAYVTAVNKIYDYVAKIKAGWTSQDNLAYIDKIEELKNAVTGCADEYKKPAAAVPDEEEIEAAEKEAAEKEAQRAPKEHELQFPKPEDMQPATPVPQPGDAPQQVYNGPVVLPSAAPTPNPQVQASQIQLPTVSLPQQVAAPSKVKVPKLDVGNIPTLDGGNGGA